VLGGSREEGKEDAGWVCRADVRRRLVNFLGKEWNIYEKRRGWEQDER
jgi:hypothetical protein